MFAGQYGIDTDALVAQNGQVGRAGRFPAHVGRISNPSYLVRCRSSPFMARASVTFQVLEGIDRGRVYRELPVPVTIGREEGNTLRLNDERVSRFHSKVQIDGDDYILTDLESTNGTRVNGTAVQIRRLRVGDRVGVGRSLLLFGSNEEIAARMASLAGMGHTPAPLGATGKSELDDEDVAENKQTLAGQLD